MADREHHAAPLVEDEAYFGTERLLRSTRDEPDPLTLAGFARRTADRAVDRRRRLVPWPWPWRWAVAAPGVAAGAALLLQATPQASGPPAGDAAGSDEAGPMHEETVDYEFALNALDEADLASFDRWPDQDPS